MRKKVLIFGSNFPLAARIAELVGREFEVISYEFSASYESGQAEVSMAFTGEMLFKALALHGALYVVFTSESLLNINSPSVLSGLLDEIRGCKKITGIHLSVVDIAEPIVVEADRVIKLLFGDSAYGKRLALVRRALDGVVDSMLKIQSFYSPEEDMWGTNFLRLLFNANGGEPIEVTESIGTWEVISADEIAKVLVTQLGLIGTTRIAHDPYPGGLRAFCAAATAEHLNWSNSQTLPLPSPEYQELFTVNHNRKAFDAGLHAVVRQASCGVNYVYRKPPEDVFGTRTVGLFRKELGDALARCIPREVSSGVDLIIPVPETGKTYAQGLAKGLGLPYLEAIYKADRKRSFDIESFDERREFLYSRLGVFPGLLSGKSVIVVDEAIFTGATLKVVSHLLRMEAVKCVYFAIPSSEARFNCKFNMQPKRVMLSEYVRKEDLASYFNVHGVFFQDEEAFSQSIEQDGPKCLSCFIQRNNNDKVF
jgi:adenine/guanine phosphoribosyltransferase-like PRPP-binding protein